MSARTVRIDGEERDPDTFAWMKARKRPAVVDVVAMPAPFEVDTMEGTMRGDTADALIRGVEGELYPCSLDVFSQTYELAWDARLDFRRFRVFRDGERTRIDTDDGLLGWGCQFPSGVCIVDWRLEAFPEEDRLDHPHTSRYGSPDDVEQGTGGVIVWAGEPADAEQRETREVLAEQR